MNKNNNSPSKGNGYVRFVPKKNVHDEQDASLIENQNDSDDIPQDSDSDRKPSGISPCRHNVRVTIGGARARPKPRASCKLKCIVFFCGVTIIIGMALISYFYSKRKNVISIGEGSLGVAELCLQDRTLKLLDHERAVRATFTIANNFPSLKYDEAENCGASTTIAGLCLNWPAYNAKLQITPVKIKSKTTIAESVQCYKVSWSHKENAPEDCLYLDDAHEGMKVKDVWYDTQSFVFWPVESTSSASPPCVKSWQHYVPGGIKSSGSVATLDNMGGTVVEPLWISSGGISLKASLHDPLSVCHALCSNATRSKICLKTQADPSHQHHSHPDGPSSNLTYIACVGQNTTNLYEQTMAKLVAPKSWVPSSDVLTDVINDGVYYENPGIFPAIRMPKTGLTGRCSTFIKKPVWNIILNGDVYTPEAVQKDLEHVADIGGTGYMSNLSDIFSSVGDFSLRNDTSAKPADIVTALHAMNWEVMFPVSPFVNYNSDNFQEAVTQHMLIHDEAAAAPVLTNVTHFGTAMYPGLIDFTNPAANKWFTKNVVEFKDRSKIDNVHLYYGQASWLPQHYSLHAPLHNPGFYSTLYTDVANSVSDCPVTDVAFSSQTDLQFVMLNPAMDLQTTLRVALASGLAGYPFFIPNLPSHLEDALPLGKKLLEEGFIRWVQLVAFFPVMHIPWDYHTLNTAGVNMTRLASSVREYTSLRNSELVWPLMELAMREVEKEGAKPIVAPIWMASGLSPLADDEFDREIYEIQDQFMVGSNLMVAPMLELGEKSRKIYFPPGGWKELVVGSHKGFIKGGQWLTYQADVDRIPVFLRHGEE